MTWPGLSAWSVRERARSKAETSNLIACLLFDESGENARPLSSTTGCTGCLECFNHMSGLQCERADGGDPVSCSSTFMSEGVSGGFTRPSMATR